MLEHVPWVRCPICTEDAFQGAWQAWVVGGLAGWCAGWVVVHIGDHHIGKRVVQGRWGALGQWSFGFGELFAFAETGGSARWRRG